MHKIMGAEDFELEWCYEQYANGKVICVCVCGSCTLSVSLSGFCVDFSLSGVFL